MFEGKGGALQVTMMGERDLRTEGMEERPNKRKKRERESRRVEKRRGWVMLAEEEKISRVEV